MRWLAFGAERSDTTGVMTLKLYSAERSGHAHTVRNLLAILGIEHETIEISTRDQQTRTDEFLAINPFGQIPVIDDDGFVVRDSHAILVYLAKKYDPSGRWLPSDAEGAARVQEWLATSTLDLVIGPAWARAIARFGRPMKLEDAQARARRLLSLIEQHLAGRAWLAADHPTIADLSMYSYVRLAPEGGVDTSAHPEVETWLGRVEGIEGFLPMPLEAV